MFSITKLTPTRRQLLPLNSIWDNSLKYLQFTTGISIWLSIPLSFFFLISCFKFQRRHLESTTYSSIPLTLVWFKHSCHSQFFAIRYKALGHQRKAMARFCSVGLCSRSHTMRETLCQARARWLHWVQGPVEIVLNEWRYSLGQASQNLGRLLLSQTSRQ